MDLQKSLNSNAVILKKIRYWTTGGYNKNEI